jgi:hypothetical protein
MIPDVIFDGVFDGLTIGALDLVEIIGVGRVLLI